MLIPIVLLRMVTMVLEVLGEEPIAMLEVIVIQENQDAANPARTNPANPAAINF